MNIKAIKIHKNLFIPFLLTVVTLSPVLFLFIMYSFENISLPWEVSDFLFTYLRILMLFLGPFTYPMYIAHNITESFPQYSLVFSSLLIGIPLFIEFFLIYLIVRVFKTQKNKRKKILFVIGLIIFLIIYFPKNESVIKDRNRGSGYDFKKCQCLGYRLGDINNRNRILNEFKCYGIVINCQNTVLDRKDYDKVIDILERPI